MCKIILPFSKTSYFELKIVIFKFHPFRTTWSFYSTAFQKLPKYTKLVEISKSQHFNPKYAHGTIHKLFGPLTAKLRSMLGPNIAPMGR